jgi:methylated-DNA-[protein]-cysteine S-methyltransferase
MPADAIVATVASTPIGPLSLLAHDGALVGAGFTADPGELHARLHPSLSPLPLLAGDVPWAAKPVLDYFGGDLTAMDGLPVHQPSTPARERLWAALRAVPPGSTVSYAELAARAGSPRAVRAAGAACAANLVAPIVPCHRVLRSDGSLGGYYYGLNRKEWLLRHEGARPA